jgi:hypothetical protein
MKQIIYLKAMYMYIFNSKVIQMKFEQSDKYIPFRRIRIQRARRKKWSLVYPVHHGLDTPTLLPFVRIPISTLGVRNI